MPERRDELVAAQYFTAVAGMAAMRGCLTRPSSVRARLDDVRTVVEHLDEFPHNLVIPVVEYDVSAGYDVWAERYDGPNPATEVDSVVVHDLISDVPPGVAVDAACGTGRHSLHLHQRGFDVVGVDANEAMLAVARHKVPGADFRVGDVASLPAEDAGADLVVCSLALTHVADLGPAVAEFGRVVRPGGTVVLSDMHPTLVTFGGAAVFPTGRDAFELHFVPNLVHQVGEYVAAATAAGLAVEACVEPVVPESAMSLNPAYAVVPDAVRQAFTDLPFLLVWRLRRPVKG